MENVLKIKLEGDAPAPPPAVTPPPKDTRHNPLLEDFFGAPPTSPTDDILEQARRKAVLAAEQARLEAANKTGKQVADATESKTYKFKESLPEDEPVYVAQRASRAKNAGHEYARAILESVEKPLEEKIAKRAMNTADMQRMQQFMTASVATQNILGGAGAGQKVAGAVQLAGSGVLGGRAAALAGGPIGVAVMAGAIVHDLVKEAVGKPFEMARKDIQMMGDAAKAVARNDALGAVAAVSNNAADKLESMGIAGKVAGEALKTVTLAATVYQETLGAFTARGRELAQYDGRIAGAAANADVTRLLADMREANRMGDRYARLIEQQAGMDARLQETLMPLKEKLTELLEKAMPGIEAGVIAGVKVLESILSTIETIQYAVEAAQAVNFSLLGFAAKSAGFLGIISDQGKKEDLNGDAFYEPFDRLTRDLDKLKISAPSSDSFLDAADRSLKFPAFSTIN